MESTTHARTGEIPTKADDDDDDDANGNDDANHDDDANDSGNNSDTRHPRFPSRTFQEGLTRMPAPIPAFMRSSFSVGV